MVVYYGAFFQSNVGQQAEEARVLVQQNYHNIIAHFMRRGYSSIYAEAGDLFVCSKIFASI